MKVGTDGVLLGAWADLNDGGRQTADGEEDGGPRTADGEEELLCESLVFFSSFFGFAVSSFVFSL